MDETLIDPEACPVVRRHRYRDTSFITPVRLRDHSAIAALFPPTHPSPNELAPPLTGNAMEEWRWLVHSPSRSAEEQGRAECDLQPTLTDCHQDRTGRLRYRPPVVAPEGRTPNDYDHLLDTRAYSPNNRVRGTWDFDPDEIARENSFTPLNEEQADSELTRASSPLHEDGSLAQMLAGALAEPTLPASSFPNITYDVRFRNNIGIRQHEVAEFTRRLRGLPPALQAAVVVIQRANNIFWMDALCEVEGSALMYSLTPEKRRIYVKVRNVYQGFKDNVEAQNKEGRDLKATFLGSLVQSWRLNRNGDNEHRYSFFKILHTTGEEHGELSDGAVIDGIKFWYRAVELIDEYDLPVSMRQTAVLRLLNLKRIEDFQMVLPSLEYWIDAVGNEQREEDGIHMRGDFWTLSGSWENALEALEDDKKMKMSSEDAEIVTFEKLKQILRSAD